MTNYQPDIQGNLNTVTDAVAATMGYQFDDIGRLVWIISPDIVHTDLGFDLHDIP